MFVHIDVNSNEDAVSKKKWNSFTRPCELHSYKYEYEKKRFKKKNIVKIKQHIELQNIHLMIQSCF